MNPTDEQAQAVEVFLGGGPLAIEAGAGTGKTSTLKLLAKSTKKRGQYIAFNRAIVDEFKAASESNIKAHTAHGLAFRAVGKDYKHRLDSHRMKSWQLAQLLGIDPVAVQAPGGRKVLQASYLASLVMRSVTRFCQSADWEPGRQHVPYVEGIDAPEKGKRTYVNNRALARHLEPFVRTAWDDLCKKDGVLPYKHDQYLKLWQLQGPYIGSEFILFDECQDANSVMLAIVEAQHRAQHVFVGDSQQQIYSFTGAINALQRIRARGAEVTFLTQSFRFGPEIALVANEVLERIGAELRLRGLDSITSVVEQIQDPDVILTRTNATAVRCVLGARHEGKRAAMVGGGQEIVAFARAAERLMRREKVEHPDLACFDSWGEVVDYVSQDAQGAELRLNVSLVEDFGVPTILEALEKMPPESRADIVVSTAHKAKGREWNRVKLAGDFPEDGLTPEELRLLYVAVTRAKRELDITLVPLLDPAPSQA